MGGRDEWRGDEETLMFAREEYPAPHTILCGYYFIDMQGGFQLPHKQMFPKEVCWRELPVYFSGNTCIMVA
jgi:hypothetical protein